MSEEVDAMLNSYTQCPVVIENPYVVKGATIANLKVPKNIQVELYVQVNKLVEELKERIKFAEISVKYVAGETLGLSLIAGMKQDYIYKIVNIYKEGDPVETDINRWDIVYNILSDIVRDEIIMSNKDLRYIVIAEQFYKGDTHGLGVTICDTSMLSVRQVDITTFSSFVKTTSRNYLL